MTNGWELKKSTISFGALGRMTLAGDDLAAPNTNATRDIRAGASGLIVHDTYTTTNFNFATTTVNQDVAVTLTGGPAYKVIIFNPSTTSPIFINFDATAVLPVAATTAGSFRLLANSYFTEFILVTTIHIIATFAGSDVHITSYT